MKYGLPVSQMIADTGDYSAAIMCIFKTLPLPKVALVLLSMTMIAFYATTFDALTMVISVYSYKKIKSDVEPDKKVRTFWAIVFILLPIALLFSEESLQSVSIIAAFPIGIIILLIIISFFMDVHSMEKSQE